MALPISFCSLSSGATEEGGDREGSGEPGTGAQRRRKATDVRSTGRQARRERQDQTGNGGW